jgi:glycosyltransferase involved in cell wall biosynthesis
MCGIAGIVDFTGHAADFKRRPPGMVRSLSAALRKWGGELASRPLTESDILFSEELRIHRDLDPNSVPHFWGDVLSHRPRVLMLGPLPPPAGGMATVMDNLRGSALVEKCRLTVLNNGKTTPEGRSPLRGVAAQVGLLGRIVGHILRHRPQLVHIHTCSGFTFWRDSLHLLAARAMARRVVWHVHGARFDEFLGSHGLIRRRLAGAALRSAAAVIVLGQDWVARLEPFAPGATWRIVANGVPMLRDDVSPSDGTFVALSLANLEPRKGLRDLISASALAARNGFAGEVLLAGRETEPGQKDDLLKHIAANGCDGRVRLLGVITGPNKETAFKRASCFVLPSYAEGLPMAMLEAMAHGMPVIATRVGAIPEVVTDGVEGFLIEPGDVAALADRMVQMERDPSLRHRMGQAARKRVEQGYSIETMVERLMAVYKEVLTGTRV